MNRDVTGGSPWTVLAWVGMVLSATLPAAPAAEPSLSLGIGMHAYYGGRFAESYESLSDAIQAGTRDPRVYYLRGLAARKIGRGPEAESDFNEGARLEALGNGGWNVGRALERVQGGDRLLLERYRAKARASLATQSRDADTRTEAGFAEADEAIFRRRRPELEGDVPAKPKAATEEPGDEDAEEPAEAEEKDEDAGEDADAEDADEEGTDEEDAEEEADEDADSDDKDAEEDAADEEDADEEEADAEDEKAEE